MWEKGTKDSRLYIYEQDTKSRTYATSRCGICLRVTWGSSGTGASETSRIDEGRIKLIILPVVKTGAVIEMVLLLEPFVMTGAVIAIAWLFRLAGVPNTLSGLSCHAH
jgi:hypothetical protein